MSAACPVCASGRVATVYALPRVPAHSVRTFRTRHAALAAPTGALEIVNCRDCGLLWNRKFAPRLMRYDEDYESTQAGSSVFDAFHRALAERLVHEHGLAGKTVVEIGCGQGEFLRLLAQAGAGRCLGYDPAYRGSADDKSIEVEAANFPTTGTVGADLVVCKMTLEHLDDPVAFLESVRRALGPGSAAPLVLTVPNAGYIAADAAFWDFYHEHAFYYRPGPLIAVLARAGFVIEGIEPVFEGQYLLATARPGDPPEAGLPRGGDGDPAALRDRFARSVDRWRGLLDGDAAAGRTVVLWGGGSKAVAFLAALDDGPQVNAVVDINPRRQGTYLPVTGHEIVSPSRLQQQPPARVIAMNPAYRAEISETLSGLGLDASLVALGDRV
ncbi:MAG: class I SAM-dependent methyltransferase [Alphaproteobacteria bacterium]|nr:class I SAM-dependent methyltransferase [Alphaproteobacteria bacterium]